LSNRLGNAGISAAVRAPIILGEDYLTTVSDLSTYGHTINAMGGYGGADLSFAVDIVAMQDWYDNGLMRHISVNDVAGNLFDGFVSEVALSYGARKLTIGPVTDIANRIAVVYTPIFVSSTTEPPVRGAQTVTAAANNTVSQSRYGIFYKLINAGECTDAEALLIRDAYLKDMAYPQKNEAMNVGDPGPLRVSIKVLGYAELLALTPYSNTSTVAITYTAFIALLAAADPNTYFSTSDEYLAANASTIVPFQDGTKNIFDVIKSVCNLGDSANTRWTFGCYEGRKLYYQPLPETEKYTYRLSEGIKSLSLYPGPTTVRPWQLRPAQWLRYTDFPLTTALASEGLVADPQVVFIESVAYKAPYGLTITGGRVSTLDQKLARMGVGSR